MSLVIARALTAFGGMAPLEGLKVVRFVFIDEGGISQREPFVVVAGVFVHGDNQVLPLEDELDRLKDKYIAPEYRSDFIFHAKEIWSGTGKIFGNREAFTLEKRLDMLRHLIRIPRKLDIPIVYFAIEKSKLEMKEDGVESLPSNALGAFSHAAAFVGCTIQIESLMRERWPLEIAQMVAEDNDQIRSILKRSHEILRDPSKADGGNVNTNILPLRKIHGSVHFASKTETYSLQLADICAFFIRGHLSGHPKVEPFYSKLKSMIIFPNGDAAPDQTITVSPPYRSDWRQ
jgi:hypothetical protein